MPHAEAPEDERGVPCRGGDEDRSERRAGVAEELEGVGEGEDGENDAVDGLRKLSKQENVGKGRDRLFRQEESGGLRPCTTRTSPVSFTEAFSVPDTTQTDM